MNRDLLSLYLVMGSSNCRGRSPVQVLEAAIRGGITLFQYREKGVRSLHHTERLMLAMQLRNVCHHHGIPFIVNDDVGLAIQIGADGVHLGQDDGDHAMIRERVKHMILGVSTHTVEEARAAAELGADYIGVGPIYPTLSKMDAEEAKGPSILSNIRSSGVTLPMTAIGGINGEVASELILAGADGIAVVSAIAGAADPEAAAKRLKEAVQSAKADLH
ncbi:MULTISPECIES: thiamine phosphate synthase [Paenibacillus]|uniref:thiamine phosphate synthase n=1 Tax=Paenibacillus TaxID=44249 RepID=UPI000B7772DD|nr:MULTISPECIES: thiamine phosphate synthase [Paenibacillus]